MLRGRVSAFAGTEPLPRSCPRSAQAFGWPEHRLQRASSLWPLGPRFRGDERRQWRLNHTQKDDHGTRTAQRSLGANPLRLRAHRAADRGHLRRARHQLRHAARPHAALGLDAAARPIRTKARRPRRRSTLHRRRCRPDESSTRRRRRPRPRRRSRWPRHLWWPSRKPPPAGADRRAGRPCDRAASAKRGRARASRDRGDRRDARGGARASARDGTGRPRAAALTRTLSELNGLLRQHGAGRRQTLASGEPNKDTETRRRELAEKLEAFVASHAGDPDDGGEPQRDAGCCRLAGLSRPSTPGVNEPWERVATSEVSATSPTAFFGSADE